MMVKMATFPQIGYEMVVFSGPNGLNLIMNPAHVPSYDSTPENLSRFELPSTRQGGGGIVYQFFENNLRQFFPNHDGLLDFAGKRLVEPISWLKSLTPEEFEKAARVVHSDYISLGLPTKKYDGGTIPDSEFGRIAEQYVMHRMGEKLMQPPRKVSAVDEILSVDISRAVNEALQEQAKQDRAKLHEAIRGRLGDYGEIGRDGKLHELARKKAVEIATGFERMLAGDPDFLL